ncbi:hypothetical protein NE237_021674 [Protea cynaroides]|uniref:Uncharacterized protein n=1 Tax=Protea cynaroides TaxID=273540 RepID=A0A9Q0HDS3_9MAGN|nr:hypothetical protein NE237_021674 [Protea cynaroides]
MHSAECRVQSIVVSEHYSIPSSPGRALHSSISPFHRFSVSGSNASGVASNAAPSAHSRLISLSSLFPAERHSHLSSLPNAIGMPCSKKQELEILPIGLMELTIW